MEFKKQNEIDKYICESGFFLSDDRLYLKTGVFEWKDINDRKNNVVEFLKKNINPLYDLEVIFPTIALSVFKNYENREAAINDNTALFEEITQSQKKFLNRSNWRLIELESVYRNENEAIKYLIYDISTKEYNPIKKSFLNDKDLKAAFKVKNIMVINRLNNDDLKNRFDKQYERELKKFDAIGVYNE